MKLFFSLILAVLVASPAFSGTRIAIVSDTKSDAQELSTAKLSADNDIELLERARQAIERQRTTTLLAKQQGRVWSTLDTGKNGSGMVISVSERLFSRVDDELYIKLLGNGSESLD